MSLHEYNTLLSQVNEGSALDALYVLGSKVDNRIGKTNALIITCTQNGQLATFSAGTVPTRGIGMGGLEITDQLLALAGNDRQPINEHTPFPIGSISKLFTVAACNHAGIDRQSNLHANVERWSENLKRLYPDEPDVAAGFATVISKTKADATILDLMNHTSGLPGIGTSGTWEDRHPYYNHDGDHAPAEKSPAVSLRHDARFNPDAERITYSNAAFVLLHMIFEAETEGHLKNYIQENIINAFKLNDTTLSRAGNKFNGAASVFSSTHDLIRLMQKFMEYPELMQDFQFEDKQIGDKTYIGHTGCPYVGDAEIFICTTDHSQVHASFRAYPFRLRHLQQDAAWSQFEQLANERDLNTDITEIDPYRIAEYLDITSPPGPAIGERKGTEVEKDGRATAITL